VPAVKQDQVRSGGGASRFKRKVSASEGRLRRDFERRTKRGGRWDGRYYLNYSFSIDPIEEGHSFVFIGFYSERRFLPSSSSSSAGDSCRDADSSS
jgi:hypothetical protein